MTLRAETEDLAGFAAEVFGMVNKAESAFRG
jgi:hypothetical protein